MAAYHDAEMLEYWVIDARDEEDIRFDIFSRGPKEYLRHVANEWLDEVVRTRQVFSSHPRRGQERLPPLQARSPLTNPPDRPRRRVADHFLGVVDACSSAGSARSSPTLPSTIAAFRSSPDRRVRQSDVGLNRLAERVLVQAQQFHRVEPFQCGVVRERDRPPADGLRFHGHTSWQTSQPKSQSPTARAAPPGSATRSSIVR